LTKCFTYEAEVQAAFSSRLTTQFTARQFVVIEIAKKGLPVPHEYHVVPNSAHVAFLTPCLPAMTTERPELCADAPVFGRVAFHKERDAEVFAFLRKHLSGANSP
jgi:hypothetical protein